MSKVRGFLNHLSAAFGITFLVFLVLDQFNPMMNFVDNTISRWMLAAFCFSGICRSILSWSKNEQ